MPEFWSISFLVVDWLFEHDFESVFAELCVRGVDIDDAGDCLYLGDEDPVLGKGLGEYCDQERWKQESG